MPDMTTSAFVAAIDSAERLSGKACLTIVGWVKPTAFSGELVGCTHPTKSFPDSL